MKKIFTLCALVCIAFAARSQAVLNEIYAEPGNGYDEFFELYNESDTAENLDNYTMVIYYEEGGKTGFYVLDLPAATVPAHGYYVGASQNPFDIQQQPGLAADFSWNAMPAGGSLTKWESNGSSYTSVPVPANLKDLFVKVLGSGGVYHILLYKNGILVNGIVGGINTTTIPAYVDAMPDLPINMSGTSPDFTIDFSAIPDNSVEYIPNSLGSNNGYYRSSDGLCGEWLKSDQPGQHNPRATNGLALSLSSANQVAVEAVVSKYATDPTKALLTYNVKSGPVAAFACTIDVYIDNGIAGQWDVSDVLLDSRVITSAPSGDQYVILSSWDVAVIIVVNGPSDCYDRTMPVGNYWSVLPVQLISFQGSMDQNNKVFLQWKVSNNKIVNQFEIERSYDGNEFKTVALVFSSEEIDIENYMFYETVASIDKVMYRLKIVDNDKTVSYSKTLIFQGKSTTANSIRILGNPVNDQLTFNYTASASGAVDVKIYDMTGKVLMKNKVNSQEGNNLVSLSLASTLAPNMYVVEVHNGSDIKATKFIKQ